ncbi:linoleate 13S-lipoxygenase 2-1, chloroplastic-like isoform X2 [Macadamia integrifolia]|uniref:linoleate 13S-lipoxygenase 2-1, chloroplastic-like isoform X2 n=1 Tax=Macadamia integrifolia TaxID=60698 RepID=UPI001C5022C8|nr:linoleate 13S-lipoxygenase 2-1, chloroplastic-like isoform X2 [Macadamia integrifolia]
MFETQVVLRLSNTYGPPFLLSLPKSIASAQGTKLLPIIPPPRTTVFPKLKSWHFHHHHCLRSVSGGGGIRATMANAPAENPITITAVLTVKISLSPINVEDILGRTFHLELASAQLDPRLEKDTIKGHARWVNQNEGNAKYESKLEVPATFGDVGAVLVVNEHPTELFIRTIVLNGSPTGPLTITCNSWVCPKSDNPQKRIFFTNKLHQSYLPSQTPNGLRKLREKELENLRGDGKGERKVFERIYDYDMYNDLGNPDNSKELARPVLGGEKHPYPRRCRTGRDPCNKDPLSEKRSLSVYVPRDEEFSDAKTLTSFGETLNAGLDALLPQIRATLTDPDLGFPSFPAIDSLFTQGMELPQVEEDQGLLEKLSLGLAKAIKHGERILRFQIPELIARDHFSWLRDEEFARQTLAGVNPYSIQLVTEWPLKSGLDPKIYGPPESAITTEIVEQVIGHSMTIDEAIKGKKLFMLDYHDVLLPYVKKVREIEGTTLYGSRTLFFLNPDGTLKSLAIELTRPPIDGKPQWKQVFLPSTDNTDSWLWKLAKSHVCAHESSYHELVNHWLRTHCCTEPYIIAANRQLSAMHPIYRLLLPHFRYTMKINSIARMVLINANGIIESSFSPHKYSMELSSVAYDKFWRFDMEGLPADLINRGMAVKDPTAEHGVKLTIKDYPFADDGLLIWTAIKNWVIDYVNHYYPDSSLVESDQELQAWWTEVRTQGHGDKKDEPWWPVLKTVENLIEILTTIIWVASCHHSAVNFGQYAYGGYFPNRPTIARTNMPTEEPSEQVLKKFIENPALALLHSFPSQIQATTMMTLYDVLSTHSIDEEYLGGKMEVSCAENPITKAAFKKFNERMKEIEAIIDVRNTDLKLKNRTGAGIVPYQLLKPFSKSGLTGMGIPNSISI